MKIWSIVQHFEINSFLNIYKCLVIKTKYTNPPNIILSTAGIYSNPAFLVLICMFSYINYKPKYRLRKAKCTTW